MTPTIRYSRSFMTTVAADDRRIAAEAPAPQPIRSPAHTRGQSLARSSSEVKARPIAGRTPSMSK